MEENKKPENPSVYPWNELDFELSSDYEREIYRDQHAGLSLRDKFAGQAMQAMVNAFYVNDKTASPDKILEQMKLISKNAYWFADKMLAEREL